MHFDTVTWQKVNQIHFVCYTDNHPLFIDCKMIYFQFSIPFSHSAFLLGERYYKVLITMLISIRLYVYHHIALRFHSSCDQPELLSLFGVSATVGHIPAFVLQSWCTVIHLVCRSDTKSNLVASCSHCQPQLHPLFGASQIYSANVRFLPPCMRWQLSIDAFVTSLLLVKF